MRISLQCIYNDYKRSYTTTDGKQSKDLTMTAKTFISYEKTLLKYLIIRNYIFFNKYYI